MLLIVVVVTMLAACTASDSPGFEPLGNSPPIPMAASVELQQEVEKLIVPTPTPGGAVVIVWDDPELDLVDAGRIVAEQNACGACHSIDGTKNVGPTWLGLYGRTEAMTGGGSIEVDEAYIIESIRNPAVKIVAGYDNAMTPYDFLSDDEVNALVEYIKTIQ